MSAIRLTKAESAAIAAFKRLESRWPSSLWLFAGGNNSLAILKKEKGKHVMDEVGAVDQRRIVATINIDSDGGGW